MDHILSTIYGVREFDLIDRITHILSNEEEIETRGRVCLVNLPFEEGMDFWR